MMTMTTTNVASLKSRLSSYLALVTGGDEVVVTSHGHPVARIVPIREAPGFVLHRPTRPIAGINRLRGIRTASAIDASAALLEDRRRR